MLKEHWSDYHAENERKTKGFLKKKRILVLASSVALTWLLIIMVASLLLRKKRKEEDALVANELVEQSHPDLPFFNLSTIFTATNNFSLANKLGQGGFGLVYKGQLSNGQEIAVKRLSKNSMQGIEEFKNEVMLIAKLQHRNLVKLLGCCIQGEDVSRVRDVWEVFNEI